MRNTETGEFELVVGNKQLLSAFFIVVLLCAVAFAMGYIVGGNTRVARPVEASETRHVDIRPETGTASTTPVSKPESSAEATPPAPENGGTAPAESAPQ